ncbi:MAG: UvrD-helicase domain-containing protein [Tissierellia bacterium]|nr:UvrD-helicase domain-containing protein [Tissierellia bacterium]
MDYINSLNDRQKEALYQDEGALLIVAGAGSGKTKVLTSKIAYLIKEKRVFPSKILAITFTNKAAREMQERVESLLGGDVNSMWIGTFHSICVRILRRFISKIGYDSTFTIYDTTDQVNVVKECLTDMNLSDELYKPRAIQSRISMLKNYMILPDDQEKMAYSQEEKKFVEIYRLYEKKKKKYNALDFDDLLLKTVELLNNDEEAREYYQNKFEYIFVDEYQDTNDIQYNLVKILAAKHKNICVVGDSDQSIYKWRGANIDNILNFEKDFKDAKTVLLEQNYRSTKNILNSANTVIKNNSKRKEKSLWTDNPEGESVIYKSFGYSGDEGSGVISKIAELRLSGEKFSEMAILYRTNAQSRVFEEELMKNGIPYKIIGGLKFYDRMEVKDIVAYLRLSQNPDDNISLKRIINSPKRGIGKVTLDRLDAISEQEGISIYNVLEKIEDYSIFNSGITGKLKQFYGLISNINYKKDTMEIKDLINFIINQIDYINYLSSDGSIESIQRVENVQEFVSVAENYSNENPDATLEDFLTNLALMSDTEKTEDADEVVTLMTIHSAKGLEFDIVFVVGLEEKIFPNARSLEEDEDLEEERRLFYVAMTRARKQLFISSAKMRTLYGQTNPTIESRFIAEMENTYVDKSEAVKTKKSDKLYSYSDRTFSGNSFVLDDKVFKKGSEGLELSVGNKVSHKKWGTGTITMIKEVPNDKQITILFDEKGLKTLMLSFAPLKVLE